MNGKDEQLINQEDINEMTKPEFVSSTEMNTVIRAMDFGIQEEEESMLKCFGVILFSIIFMFVAFGAATVLTILAALVGMT